ncbi:MAG: hypothetical protein U0V75_00630 [Ferruginibacter sp.]
MASPAANIPANLLFPFAYQQIICDSDRLRNRSLFVDTTYPYPSMDNTLGKYILESFEEQQTILPQTKVFISYIQRFNKEYEHHKEFLIGYSEEEIRQKVTSSLSNFLTLNPDALSIEISEDATLFYTIKKNNKNFYIDQYIDLNKNEDDEFILTAFKSDEVKLISSGSITRIINDIQNSTISGE